MKISDLISMCVKNLTRRKVRTFLTVIGVVVGTCAIVVMISIGVGMDEAQKAMLAEMGDLTMINVYNYGGNSKTKLDDKVIAEIQALDGVEVATPMYTPNNLQLEIVAGKNERYVMNWIDIVGIYPEAIEKLGYEIKEGVSLSESKLKYPILFGEKTAYNFKDSKRRPGHDMVRPYPNSKGEIEDPYVSPMKEKIKFKTTPMNDKGKEKYYDINVVGILKEDYSKSYYTSTGVFMDITELKRIESEYRKANGMQEKNETNYQEVFVKVKDIKYVEAVEEYIKNLGYNTHSLESIRKPMQQQAKQQQMVLGSLGAISLFVAALGITNTMVMSIYERTREIGVMKVLGCYVTDIRTVFLMEAGCIGFFGGVIGVVLSYIISFAINYFGVNLVGGMMRGAGGMGMKISIIPFWLVFFALVFATMVGLASGFYPANRAVKISALEAIKHD